MNRRRIPHLLATALLMLAVANPAAGAAPPGPPGPSPVIESAADATAIPWRQFGRAETLELRGGNAEARVDIPMTAGVTATRVSGQIGAVVNIISGHVDVLDGRGTPLGRILVPADSRNVAFTVDTSGAEVANSVLTLNFALRSDNPPTDTCAPAPSVTLSGLSTGLEGRSPYPDTVARFLPPYLNAVTIWTGSDPSADQQQAALTLTAVLTRAYRPVPVRVEIDTSARAPQADIPGRRVITIHEGPQVGIEVENAGTPQAVLAITGRGSELSNQTALFLDRRSALAQSRSATIGSAGNQLTPTSSTMTFEQLGIAVSTSVSGMNTVYAGFDSAAFAVGPIESASINLRARYTPTADDQSSVLIRSGTYVLATERLDSSGILELTFDIPPETINSDIGMALELQYFPSGGGEAGGCAPLNDRMTFAVDPRSTVEVTPGAAGSGFASLPAAFTPEFNVAVDSPDLIGYAAQAINLIGQRTATLLRPQVVSLVEGAASGAALLAVTGGEGVRSFGMQPPVSVDGSGTVDIDGAVDTGAALNGPLAVVQSLADNGRLVLAIDIPGRRELADKNFDYIRQLDNGWSSLTGDVVATGAAGDTVKLTIRSDRPMSNRPDVKTGWKWSAAATAAVGVAALAAAVRALIVRRRRSRG